MARIALIFLLFAGGAFLGHRFPLSYIFPSSPAASELSDWFYGYGQDPHPGKMLSRVRGQISAVDPLQNYIVISYHPGYVPHDKAFIRFYLATSTEIGERNAYWPLPPSASPTVLEPDDNVEVNFSYDVKMLRLAALTIQKVNTVSP